MTPAIPSSTRCTQRHRPKRCGHCHRLLPLSYFYPDLTTPDGRNRLCMVCQRDIMSRTYAQPSGLAPVPVGITVWERQARTYTPPAITFETDLETRAGSPLACATPLYPLPQSELDKCK